MKITQAIAVFIFIVTVGCVRMLADQIHPRYKYAIPILFAVGITASMYLALL